MNIYEGKFINKGGRRTSFAPKQLTGVPQPLRRALQHATAEREEGLQIRTPNLVAATLPFETPERQPF